MNIFTALFGKEPKPSEHLRPLEPRPRYRGKVITQEGTRTVGTVTYRTITLENGETLDLNEAEYRNEVHVSYPPEQ